MTTNFIGYTDCTNLFNVGGILNCTKSSGEEVQPAVFLAPELVALAEIQPAPKARMVVGEEGEASGKRGGPHKERRAADPPALARFMGVR